MSDLIVSVSGVRGIFGRTLTPQIAWEFGCAFAAMLGGRGRRVVLGRDTRPSGHALRDAAVKGLNAGGLSVVDLGVVTTPGVGLMTRALSADGGVVITASHNPGEYNGLKFLQANGSALTGLLASRLKDLWNDKQYTLAAIKDVGTCVSNDETNDRHIEAVCGICDPPVIAKKHFRVVLDSINGAGAIVTPKLLERLGCELIPLNAEPTGDFAHRPEPIAENLEELTQTVKDNHADIGFAQDPDADRLVVVDETGRFLGEEYTLALAAQQRLRQDRGDLATNLSTSRMIDDVAAAAGSRVFRVPTGEANVVEAMVARDCVLGGEGNGGVIDPRVGLIRDSLVGMGLILSALAETGKTVSALAATIPAYRMIKTKLRARPRTVREVIRRTREAFADADGARFNDADGLRVDLPGGWVTVRGSNTEPIMRIIAEAPQAAAAEELMERVRAIAEEAG